MSRPWMPLYIDDYLGDTAHLRAAESGAYLHLIMHYWKHGLLPQEDSQLATIAKMSRREWARARVLIQPLFQVGWRHKRIEKELCDAREKYERRAAAGRKGGVSAKRGSSNAQAMLNQLQPEPEKKDDGDDARAREREEFQIALKIGVIAGYPDATYWPERWSQAPRRVRAFLDAGYTADMLVDGAQQAMAHKRDGPPYSIAYFEKSFARARALQEKPLPEVTTLEPQRTTINAESRNGSGYTGKPRGQSAAALALIYAERAASSTGQGG
jgi:uncharacterized protein YdaU (DUF1376 family)